VEVLEQLTGKNPKKHVYLRQNDRESKDKIPIDSWKQPIQCYLNADGEFVVYSFGPNKKDEKGQGDDLVLSTTIYNKYMADGTRIFCTLKKVSVPLTRDESGPSAQTNDANGEDEALSKPESRYEFTFWVQTKDEKTPRRVWHFDREHLEYNFPQFPIEKIYDVQYQEDTLIVVLHDEKRVVVYLVPGNAEGTVLFQKADLSKVTITGSLKEKTLTVKVHLFLDDYRDPGDLWHWDGKEWVQEPRQVFEKELEGGNKLVMTKATQLKLPAGTVITPWGQTLNRETIMRNGQDGSPVEGGDEYDLWLISSVRKEKLWMTVFPRLYENLKILDVYEEEGTTVVVFSSRNPMGHAIHATLWSGTNLLGDRQIVGSDTATATIEGTLREKTLSVRMCYDFSQYLRWHWDGTKWD
jgi:hypothetical protein